MSNRCPRCKSTLIIEHVFVPKTMRQMGRVTYCGECMKHRTRLGQLVSQ